MMIAIWNQRRRGICFIHIPYLMEVQYGASKSPKKSFIRAAQLAKKALSLDATLPSAYTLLSGILTAKRAYEKAITMGEKAIALNPNWAVGHAALGRTLMYAGQYKEGLAQLKKAIRLSPVPRTWYLIMIGSCYQHLGKQKKAIEEFKKVLQQNPNDLFAHIYLAVSYSLLGREIDAQAEAAEVLRINPKFSVEHIAKTWPYKNRADIMVITDALRKAGLN